MKNIKAIIGFLAGSFVSMIFIMTIDRLFGFSLSGGTGSIIFSVFFAFVFMVIAIDNFWKTIGVSIVLFIFLALVKDINLSSEK